MRLPWQSPKEHPPVDKPIKDNKRDMAELNASSAVSSVVEHAINEMVKKSTDFQAFDDIGAGGNYYGSEFNIRATAGRIKGTYSREPWVFATASLIARTLSTVPYIVKSRVTKETIPNHPLLEVMNTGSDAQDAYSMNWSGYLDLILGGNYFQVFDKKYTESIHVPVEDCQVNLAADGKRIQSVTVFDTAGQSFQGIDIPYEQVIHRKFPNPYNRFYGLSLYVAASRPVILDRYMNEFNMAFYLRGATNAGVIETTEDIGRTRMQRLIRTYEQLYTGKRNWFRTIFIPKGGKWVKSGLTMAEAQHLETLKENRYTILAILGVPPAKVGLTQDVNYSTSGNQDKDFWENTIRPLAKFIAAGWNHSYIVKTIYNNSVYVEPDFSQIEALTGDIVEKGKHIAAVKDVLWIDEIRRDILGYDELPDGKGQMFVSQVSGNDVFSGLLSATGQSEADIDDTARKVASLIKSQATDGQERLEASLSKGYLSAYLSYVDELIGMAEDGLRNGIDVRQHITDNIDELKESYKQKAMKPLFEAVKRGFSFASATTKAFAFNSFAIKMMKQKIKHKNIINYRQKLNDVDQQAVDLLRDIGEDGQRTILEQRAIDTFLGFNKTRTNEILNIIADGFENGDTADVIAGNLRGQYTENYKNQAFTIARTEILTSISQGIKWNHDVLGEVFSDVEKQWFHVGDVGTNPEARANHAAFEDEGPQIKGYKWGGVLEYPRDPAGGPNETINCRCTMASVIPDNATSNAEFILDTIG